MRSARGGRPGRVWMVLMGVTGCASLFGYEYPQPNCTINSDCPPEFVCLLGLCARQCNDSARDCQPGQICSIQHLCVSYKSGADASVVEVASADATAAGEGAPEDGDVCRVTAGVTACGPCADTCSSRVCTDQGSCLYPLREFPPNFPYPPPAQGPTAPFSPDGNDGLHGIMVGESIHLPRGVVVELGVVADYRGVNGYLGLYSNVNSQPGTLVVGTNEFATAGGPLDQGNPLPTAVPVAPTFIDEADYWVAGIWQSTIFVSAAFPEDQCDSGRCLPFYSFPVPFGPPPPSATARAPTSSPSVLPPIGLFVTVAPFPQ